VIQLGPRISWLFLNVTEHSLTLLGPGNRHGMIRAYIYN
jgi:hypothetical protein